MSWLDVFIVLFIIAALVRGSEVGFIRQFCSTIGFFVGLFAGAWINGLLDDSVTTPGAKAIMALITVLGFALASMGLGEYLGLIAKYRLRDARITNKLDKVFGSVLSVVTLLAAIWLGAAIFRNIPDSGWQRQVRGSHVVTFLDNRLPSAPVLLSQLGHLIDPNNFPQVFNGLEPALKTDAPLPDMGALTPAVEKVRPSVVKVEGEGCNSIVEGSGFVTGDDVVVTNAHVVAGVNEDLFIWDQGGKHDGRVVLFDPNLDLAVLRAGDKLAGKPLELDGVPAPNGTPTAVLGYPSGAGFTAGPGAVLEMFQAQGRNIYDRGRTVREVYSVKADVAHGNSGGPMIDKEGKVIGVIFAKSVNYSSVGYALTMQQVINKVNQARGLMAPASTSSCTD